MKLTVTQENFSKALSFTSKAVSSKPSIPVLSNVLLEVINKRLKISATDLEFGVTTLVGADIKEDGSITVLARTLAEFISSLGPGKIDILLEDNILRISNNQNSADFNTIPSDEFPPMPQISGDKLFSINALEFAKSITKVAIASAQDDSRPILTGVLCEGSGNSLIMVGVDGFRLSHKQIKLGEKLKQDIHFVIPAKSLEELARIITTESEKDDMVDVYLLNEKNQMLFKVNDVELSTRLIEGDFPDYKKILPEGAAISFKVEKDALANGIKVVNIFARSAVGNKCLFAVNADNSDLKLAASVADVGENESHVEIHDVSGDNFETAYNTKFLTDMVSIMEGDELTFESNGVTAAGVFKDKSDKNFLHLVMPMRVE